MQTCCLRFPLKQGARYASVLTFFISLILTIWYAALLSDEEIDVQRPFMISAVFTMQFILWTCCIFSSIAAFLATAGLPIPVCHKRSFSQPLLLSYLCRVAFFFGILTMLVIVFSTKRECAHVLRAEEATLIGTECACLRQELEVMPAQNRTSGTPERDLMESLIKMNESVTW